MNRYCIIISISIGYRSRTPIFREKFQRLLLVASGFPATASRFELAPLGPDERFDMASWLASRTEVPLGNTSLTRPLEQQGVFAGGSKQSQLVESNNFTSSLQNPFPGFLRYSKGTQSHLEHRRS